MSKAPTTCFYCRGTGQGPGAPCGFCENGSPRDTQADWDATWGKLDYIFVCPNRTDFGPHKVRWNKGEPICLTCGIPAVAVTTPTLVKRREENG